MDRGCVHVGSLRCGRGHGARVTGAAEGGETAISNAGACAPGVGGRCEGHGRRRSPRSGPWLWGPRRSSCVLVQQGRGGRRSGTDGSGGNEAELSTANTSLVAVEQPAATCPRDPRRVRRLERFRTLWSCQKPWSANRRTAQPSRRGGTTSEVSLSTVAQPNSDATLVIAMFGADVRTVR
jgi:hypothetical protein